MAVEEEGLRVFQSVKIKIGEFWSALITRFIFGHGEFSLSIVTINGYLYEYIRNFVI